MYDLRQTGSRVSSTSLESLSARVLSHMGTPQRRELSTVLELSEISLSGQPLTCALIDPIPVVGWKVSVRLRTRR